MVASNWVNLEGQVVGQKYRLIHVIEPGSQEARFAAESVDPRAQSRAVIAISTRNAGLGVRLDDLQHPHLRQVFEAGQQNLQGLEIRYVVMENVGESLADVLRRGPLEERAARELALEAGSALDYLHRRGYVYAGLRPASIAQSDRGWVLTDFEMLRREGTVDPAETRLMLAASPTVPPDAYGGLVSPAWDVWSLGVVLNQALTGAPERGGRRSKPAPAPPPFDAIIRGCLDPNPHERIGLRDVAGLLGTELPGRAGRQQESREPPRSLPPVVERTAPVPPSRPTPEHRNGYAHADAHAADSPVSSVPPRSAARRARIYSAPPAERTAAPTTAEYQPRATRSEEETDSQYGEGASPRRRILPMLALGLLAIGIGVVLAVVNTGDQGESSRTRADAEAPRQTNATPVPAAPAPEPPPRADPAARKAALVPFIIDWARSMRELDLDRHVAYYAPHLDVFFTKRAVPLSGVRAEKEQLFSGISSVRRLSVRDIRIESFQPEEAVVTFRKDWDFRGARGTAGAERQRLTLRWIEDAWRIAGEQEIAVYWTRKQRGGKGD